MSLPTFQKCTCFIIAPVAVPLTCKVHHVPNSTPSTITKYTSTFKCNVASSATTGTPCATVHHVPTSDTSSANSTPSTLPTKSSKYFRVNNPKTFSIHSSF